MSFDLIAFDPIAFDPIAFDPRLFDPMLVTHNVDIGIGTTKAFFFV